MQVMQPDETTTCYVSGSSYELWKHAKCEWIELNNVILIEVSHRPPNMEARRNTENTTDCTVYCMHSTGDFTTVQ